MRLQDEAKTLQNGVQTCEDTISSLNSTITLQENELKEMRDDSVLVETAAEDTLTKIGVC